MFTDWSSSACTCCCRLDTLHSWICTAINKSQRVRTTHRFMLSEKNDVLHDHSCTHACRQPVGSGFYSWWMVIIATPIMLTAELLYTIIDNNRTVKSVLGAIVSSLLLLYLKPPNFFLLRMCMYVAGVCFNSYTQQINFISASFLTALGFYLGYYGLLLQQSTPQAEDLETDFYLQFVGAMITGLFWVRTSLMQQYYCELTRNQSEFKSQGRCTFGWSQCPHQSHWLHPNPTSKQNM